MNKPLPAPRSLTRRQRGVGMIEVLVAIVVLAFGLLGLAGLQTRVLAYSQSSLFRSQAAALTDDILDRMRADRARALGTLWNTALDTDLSTIDDTFPSSDLKNWKQEVAALLPMGRASISVNGSVVTIVVQWDDTRGREGSQQFSTTSRL